jgi:hypothetical protein
VILITGVPTVEYTQTVAKVHTLPPSGMALAESW